MGSALRRLHVYRDDLEMSSPSYKGRGVFYFDSNDLVRPEVTRHVRRLETQFLPSAAHGKLLLASAPSRRPFSQTREYEALRNALDERLREDAEDVLVCFYAAPFGVVPVDLAETYPLSQFEAAEPLDLETLAVTADAVGSFVDQCCCHEVVIYSGEEALDSLVEAKCREALEGEGRKLRVVVESDRWGKGALERLVGALKA